MVFDPYDSYHAIITCAHVAFEPGGGAVWRPKRVVFAPYDSYHVVNTCADFAFEPGGGRVAAQKSLGGAVWRPKNDVCGLCS